MQLYVVNWKLSPGTRMEPWTLFLSFVLTPHIFLSNILNWIMSAILEARLETVAQLSLLVTPGSTVNACIPRIIHFCFGEAKWRQMLAKVLYHIPYLSPNFSLPYPVASWTYWQSMEWYELAFCFFFRKTNCTKPILWLNEGDVADCPSAMHLPSPRQGARLFGYVGWHCRLLFHSFPLPFQVTKPSSKLVCCRQSGSGDVELLVHQAKLA